MWRQHLADQILKLLKHQTIIQFAFVSTSFIIDRENFHGKCGAEEYFQYAWSEKASSWIDKHFTRKEAKEAAAESSVSVFLSFFKWW